MKILVAEDDQSTLFLLKEMATSFGCEVVTCTNGRDALELLQKPHAPRIALLDWIMPYVDGIDVCKKLREKTDLLSSYIILITVRDRKDDIVLGLEAGANDYITKPFHSSELKARLSIGIKTQKLQDELRILRGLLPICSWCKKVRSETETWVDIESYLEKHTQAEFTHGVCPECKKSQKQNAS